ncbi:hypothetical protein P8452_43563 [Trifolium repens]|nr:hypothetical protein QL285_028477 [Trifolium repens]WJX58072.1 hypothetical protein P8452_43563 [Trifolium repens]
MVVSATILITTIINMLSVSLDNVMENLTTFSELVDDLIKPAWLLSREQIRFLSTVVRLKAELLASVPIIKDVENDLRQKRQQLRFLAREGMALNAASVNHVLILEALQNEESLFSMNTTTKTVQILERKKEIRAQIQENIKELLEKKRSLKIFKMELKDVLKKISKLMRQMVVMIII